MSYSGEWVHAIRTDVRKTTTVPSPPTSKSLPSTILRQSRKSLSLSLRPYPSLIYPLTPVSTIISSSDSEPETTTTPPPPPAPKGNRLHGQSLSVQTIEVHSSDPNRRASKMLLQTSVDEQKLKFVKDRIATYANDMSHTQPLPRRICDPLPLSPARKDTLEGRNSSVNQLPQLSPLISKRTAALKSMHKESQVKEGKSTDDGLLVTSSSAERVAQSLRAARNRLKIKRDAYHSSSRKFASWGECAPCNCNQLTLCFRHLNRSTSHPLFLQ